MKLLFLRSGLRYNKRIFKLNADRQNRRFDGKFVSESLALTIYDIIIF